MFICVFIFIYLLSAIVFLLNRYCPYIIKILEKIMPTSILSFTEDDVKRIVRNYVIEKLNYDKSTLGTTEIRLSIFEDKYDWRLPCFDNLTIEINIHDYIQDNFKTAA